MIIKSDKEMLFEVMDGIRKGIIADLTEKEISDSDLDMLVVAEDDEAILVGDAHYFFILAKGTRRKPEGGRKPGPVSEEGQAGLLEWIRKKPVVADDDIDERSLLFLIARKLKEHGNDIYMGKRPGLELDRIIDQAREVFKQELHDKYLQQFGDMFSKSLRSVFHDQ